MVPIALRVTTGSTYASRAAVTPEAASGPATPAKKMPNATGIVTIAASHAVPLTAVSAAARAAGPASGRAGRC
jgi:hypothetical protein